MSAITTTPPVPSYWNGRPVVAAVKFEPAEDALFRHQWVAVIEAAVGFSVMAFVWTGNHIPRVGFVRQDIEDYRTAVAVMMDEAGL